MNTKEDNLYLSGEYLPVAECFYSLQGEGFHTGIAAGFVRLCGCNVHCEFCDSKTTWDISKCRTMSVKEIAEQVSEYPSENVVITGGEPLLYNLDPLCKALCAKGKKLWLETSASLPMSGKWDWICISPKDNCPPLEENLIFADEIKLVITRRDDLAKTAFYENKTAFYFAETGKEIRLSLQAEWSVNKEVIEMIIDFIKRHPRWTLSLQTHKWLEIR